MKLNHVVNNKPARGAVKPHLMSACQ
jgi:hypothetical protein